MTIFFWPPLSPRQFFLSNVFTKLDHSKRIIFGNFLVPKFVDLPSSEILYMLEMLTHLKSWDEIMMKVGINIFETRRGAVVWRSNGDLRLLRWSNASRFSLLLHSVDLISSRIYCILSLMNSQHPCSQDDDGDDDSYTGSACER